MLTKKSSNFFILGYDVTELMAILCMIFLDFPHIFALSILVSPIFLKNMGFLFSFFHCFTFLFFYTLVFEVPKIVM